MGISLEIVTIILTVLERVAQWLHLRDPEKSLVTRCCRP